MAAPFRRPVSVICAMNKPVNGIKRTGFDSLILDMSERWM